MNLALRSCCPKSRSDKTCWSLFESIKRRSARRKLASLLAFAALFSSADVFAQANTAYFTEPTLHNNTLVFASQGDLWIADVSTDNEQTAVRLSSHINVESQPRISPDGNSLAFVSDYASVPSVYVMPSIGGTPRQVSFELMPSKLLGWVDNSTLLYSTMSATGMHSSYELKMLNLRDLNTNTLPLSDAVQGTISEDGGTVFFIQFGLQISSDNANQYRGGASGELWSYDLASKREARHLSVTHSGSVSYPMLYQERLFFVSNQSGLDNIWSMTKNGDDLRQHTNFTDWAVRSPSVSNNSIVFQHGADLKQLNLATDEVSTYSILLQSDNTLLRTHYVNKPLKYLENTSISHDGKKVVLTARGRIAVTHTDTTRLMNITTDPTSRSRHGILSKDGKQIYAISDVSGEYEIWQFDARGKDTPKQLTDDGSILRTGLWLSPSGELLAHTDKSGKVFLLDLSSGKNRLIMDAKAQNSITDLVFSSDSQFLSFAYQALTSERAQIYLRDIKSGKNKLLTSTKYHAYSPTFSSDSQWLYFLSDRSFTPTPGSPWGDRNMGQMLDKRGQIFAISLGTNSPFPFAAPNELDTPIADDADENDTPAKIEFENIETRLWQVDAPSGNYQNLIATESHLFVLERDDSRSSDLKAIEFGFGNKLKNVTGGVNNIAISGDGKQLLVQKGIDENTKLFVIPVSASFPDETDDVSVKLTNWSLAITPEDEWQQIFKDAWLMHRDSLFDANMRGIDWQASKQKYMPLLSRVSARHELNDIFEQMMGELNALHSQVRGGDISNDMNAPAPASLGAAYLDGKNGVEIARIYQFDREQLSQAPPLAMPGVNAQNGDIITAINGKNIKNTAELQNALLNSAGAQVLLDLKRGRKSHQTIVVPVEYQTEARYRYQDWVITNLNKVTQINSDIGYLHLYAMGANDIASFAREFYAQYEKPGLIIDVRRNRGGNIDSVIIEKLMRRAWSFWQSSDGGKSTNMQQAFRGHLVVLADQFTYSDGETFTAGIRALKLGTVIGKQTAGAGVWLSGGNRVVDGGIARVAEFPVYAMDGRWITEGRGISPDIEVANLPHATFNGEDAQLMAAIDYLQNKLVSEPINDYKAFPFPAVETPAHDIK